MEKDETENQIKGLTSRIHELEVIFKDKKKYWYQDTGLWISIIAVIFSIFTGIHEIIHQSSEDLKSKRAEVLQNVSDLISTDYQFQSEAKKHSVNLEDYHDDALDTKFKILLSRIDVLNNEIPGLLSYYEYSYIAHTYGRYGGDYGKSISYYLNALKLANKWTDSFYTCEQFGKSHQVDLTWQALSAVPLGDGLLLNSQAFGDFFLCH